MLARFGVFPPWRRGISAGSFHRRPQPCGYVQWRGRHVLHRSPERSQDDCWRHQYPVTVSSSWRGVGRPPCWCNAAGYGHVRGRFRPRVPVARRGGWEDRPLCPSALGAILSSHSPVSSDVPFSAFCGSPMPWLRDGVQGQVILRVLCMPTLVGGLTLCNLVQARWPFHYVFVERAVRNHQRCVDRVRSERVDQVLP